MNTYIPPTGTIQMLVGVHLNPKQEDTLYFEGPTIRDTYFERFVYRTYDEQSYSRPTRNSVKIQDTAGKLYRCQYMRFKNGDAFGGVWIYAFVTAVEYVNNNTCEVFYEIDNMVTWFPWCTLRECFVEREIPVTDNLYENLVPEDVETGDYTTVAEAAFDLSKTAIVMSAVKAYWHKQGDVDDRYSYIEYADNNYKYGEVNDVFCPLIIYTTDTDSSTDMQAFYNTVKRYVDDGHSEDIVNMQYVPQFITKGMKYAENPSTSTHYNTDYQNILRMSRLGERYIPKNKKLYTFPYIVLNVSNQQGQIKQYKWEDFNIYNYVEGNPEIEFIIYGTFYSNPTVVAVPTGYKGLSGSGFDYAVTLTNFPPAPWICDTYKAYLAQNKASIATSILSDAVGGIASGAAGIALGMPGFGVSAVAHGANIAKTIAGVADKQNMPNKVANLSQTDAFNLITGTTRILFTQMTIKDEQARIIDNYFSMYGYAQNKIKTPNINSRPCWNYVKTQGCIVVGDVPADALANISAIFDKGIRFWKDMSYIGNYELDNSPA